MTNKRQMFTLTICDAGMATAPLNVRLRRALKWLLRCFRLRVVSIVPDVESEEPEPKSDNSRFDTTSG